MQTKIKVLFSDVFFKNPSSDLALDLNLLEAQILSSYAAMGKLKLSTSNNSISVLRNFYTSHDKLPCRLINSVKLKKETII